LGILFTIAYNGTRYCGWQSQTNAVSVYDTLQAALVKVLGMDDFSLLGASRTDSGVHALGQRAHLRSNYPIKIPAERLPHALNSALPKDISILGATMVDNQFHPINDAKSKTYSYKIYNHLQRNPLLWDFSAYIPMTLDVEKMQAACAYFIGKHDFAGFCSVGSVVTSTVREIFSLEIIKDGHLLEILVNGNGFLYNMVRIITGTLVAVGVGRISPDDIPDIIKSGERKRAGKTMLPQGLTLVEVFY